VVRYLRIPKNRFGLEPMALEVIYFAKKKIWPGEQLLVSYEDGEEQTYWGVMGIKPYPLTPKTFQLSESLRLIKGSAQNENRRLKGHREKRRARTLTSADS